MAIYTATTTGSGVGGLQWAFNNATANGDQVFLNTAAITLTSQYTWNAPANAKFYGLGSTSTLGGGDATVITDFYNVADNAAILIASSGSLDIAGITFAGSGSLTQEKPGGGLTISGTGYGLRIHHCRFDEQSFPTIGNTGGGSCTIGGTVAGVMDHCIITSVPGNNNVGPRAENGRGYDAYDAGDTSWTMPTYRGQDGLAYTFVMEDCQIDYGYAQDASRGGRWVIRFCNYTTTGGNIQTHSTGGGGRVRGSRSMEAYCNNLIAPSGYIPNTPIYISSGCAMVWGNYAPSSTPPDTGMQNLVQLHNNRMGIDPYPQGYPPSGGWGYSLPRYQTGTVSCVGGTTTITRASGSAFDTTHWLATEYIFINGTTYSIVSVTDADHMVINADPGVLSGVTYVVGSPWDGTSRGDLLAGIPSLDCPGQGQCSDLIINNGSGNPVNHTQGDILAWPNQATEPVQVFANNWTPVHNNPGSLVDLHNYGFTLNTDYMTDEVGSKITVGPLSSRPGSASEGDRWWAPEQGSWRTAVSSIGVAYTQQGKMYLWTSGAWTDYYTPLQYPHPLVTATPATVSSFPQGHTHPSHGPRGGKVRMT